MAGRPFAWTPRGGPGSIGEGGLIRRCSPRWWASRPVTDRPGLGGEGNPLPIGVLMKFGSFILWKNITDIGGYRVDSFTSMTTGSTLM